MTRASRAQRIFHFMKLSNRFLATWALIALPFATATAQSASKTNAAMPCFFTVESDVDTWQRNFSVALDQDVGRGRVTLLATFNRNTDKIDHDLCPAVRGVVERERATLLRWYDTTLAQPQIEARLERVWAKRWSPKLCELVERATRLNGSLPLLGRPRLLAPEASARERLDALLGLLGPADWLATTGTRETMLTTLKESTAELDRLADETNAALRAEISKRLKQVTADASAALDLCIEAETKRLNQ
jgi:hypothetical protein